MSRIKLMASACLIAALAAPAGAVTWTLEYGSGYRYLGDGGFTPPLPDALGDQRDQKKAVSEEREAWAFGALIDVTERGSLTAKIGIAEAVTRIHSRTAYWRYTPGAPNDRELEAANHLPTAETETLIGLDFGYAHRVLGLLAVYGEAGVWTDARFSYGGGLMVKGPVGEGAKLLMQAGYHNQKRDVIGLGVGFDF